jgi:hypothetical protein
MRRAGRKGPGRPKAKGNPLPKAAKIYACEAKELQWKYRTAAGKPLTARMAATIVVGRSVPHGALAEQPEDAFTKLVERVRREMSSVP